MSPAPDRNSTTPSPHGGRSIPSSGGIPATGARDELVMSREEAAAELGLSVNGLGLAMQRGECDGMFDRYGRCVRFYRPVLQLRALGLRTPSEFGEFCRGLGLRDLPSLLRWLGNDDESQNP